MARPKKEKELRHNHQIMLRLTDMEYEIVSTNTKNTDYGEAQRYLMFQYDEYTGKPILDESGRLIPREEYYLDGINCDPFNFETKFQTQKAFLRTAVEDAAASARILEEFQKVDLQQCVKAQQSQAYAQRVKLSNLQQMTKTVAYVQEYGYDTQDDLQSDFLEAQSQTAEIRKALRSTEQKLKEVSEQIRYTGQRLSFMRLPLTLSSILPLLALHFPVTS